MKIYYLLGLLTLATAFQSNWAPYHRYPSSSPTHSLHSVVLTHPELQHSSITISSSSALTVSENSYSRIVYRTAGATLLIYSHHTSIGLRV